MMRLPAFVPQPSASGCQLNQQMLLTFWRKAVWWNCEYEEKFTKHFKRLSL